ncbi:diamine N-acetyltransferase [Winogradskyella wandonensis]|uniref:Diamine N-acetyltransferase n=1 Tax=Winogradskyella wandonensis TaxID=1442586 RepID=A0A4V2PT15_9FLAO|nr:GNAT family N-acetyltransferase [Winogradskyella wandonensis]TCK64731.1 diamine N-acetyltransferase [Winogradskyella wandonensis]
MVTLKSKHIYLRALEPEDLEFVYKVENDESIWHLSHTQTPYSRFLVKQYLENAHQDIYEAKQLRLVISSYDNETLGLIDVFDFDFKNKRAGIGIVITDEASRGKGFGSEALSLLINYCFSKLQLHQLFCNISENNKASLTLFENKGFKRVGLKKEWNFTNNGVENEYLLQLINK